MESHYSSPALETLKQHLDGDIFTDIKTRLLYATDASVYREIPFAVARPRNEEDIKLLVEFAGKNNIPLIPRTAGTSLAGQVVGYGMVVDFSKHMNRILEFNPEEKWVKVQPGVILDELNEFLKPHGLFFGPETSTSNRCMIGGMVANNSCGSHSLVYGSTRDHTIELRSVLSDGSIATFHSLTADEFRKKCIGNSLENNIYQNIFDTLSEKNIQDEIEFQYPEKNIHRRNTGYALDLLLESNIFSDSVQNFNFCRLLAGSEGSLAIFTEIKLALVPLPPVHTALVCVHIDTIKEALLANLTALAAKPVAVELIDRIVLDCTKTNISQAQNRFFIKGDPGAILVVEFAENSEEEIDKKVDSMIQQMKNQNLGYHFPVLKGKDISKVWALRKAGLGLLSNVPGDAKPVAVIEDTAIHVEALPDFVAELQVILDTMNLQCVYYAHIGTGEIHIRPILNLKNKADVERFYQIALETASLVKKYKGSLSGEHGDGRLRGEFIPLMLGETIYQILRELKQTWDPENIFNPGKIVDTPSMKTSLRYTPGAPSPKLKTYFRYPEAGDFLKAVEKCNGSGDCRKPHTFKGVMCPSYHATKDEHDTTRGRANILREFVSNSPQKNPFDHKEIKEILDLCLSCKGCKSECPSNVDMGKYKAEFLQHYYDANGAPFRSKLIASYSKLNKLGSLVPSVYNLFSQSSVFSPVVKKLAGFAKNRSLPRLHKETWRSWADKNLRELNKTAEPDKKVVLFCDEFTNYNDTPTGINACLLLNRLGYYIDMPPVLESGRAGLSKGFLKKVAKLANANIEILQPWIDKKIPVVGIEPSAILSLRDEYKDLCSEENREKAEILTRFVYIIDEFICQQSDQNKIDRKIFKSEKQRIYLHGHCHQKALSSVNYTLKMLSIPQGFEISEIDCGCCGMAGSFGYEKEHYDLSMAIGELKLFPAIRAAESEALISATGTSCRHQILDGTGKIALHPVDILWDAVDKQ
ncbi:MAG: FAD-binding protein [Bacteroidales bacterium]|nr:FAD-binding protein [Bacteroidales bacterium]